MTALIERTARFTAPAAVALFAVVAAVLGDRPAGVAVLTVAAVAALAVVLSVLALRGWVLVAGCTVALAGFTVLAGGAPADVGWFGVCVLAGWCAFRAPLAPALAFGAVATASFVVQALVVTEDSGWAAWISGTVFTTLACLMAAHQRDLLAQLREAQAGLADRARSEERTRIAREMHDVVGHALTVTLLHISSARLAVDDEPEAARASLEQAEQHARRSLEEIRASVGLLRDEAPARTPLPGGADLGELVETFRRTGAPVACRVHGDPASLPATTGLAAYRIVQEALTNAARHAPGAATDVEVWVDGARTRVVVESAAPTPRRTTAPAAGTGLLGMRERAEAVGGRLTAGPAGPGWRVEAELPG